MIVAIILYKMKTNIKKLTNKNFLFSFILILVLFSCTSDFSNKKMKDISLIETNIDITQDPTDNSKNEIEVILVDKKGKRISNDSLTIFVNGIEEKLNHKQGLYYSDESKYKFLNVPVKDVYNVEIKLSNGEKHFLGSVKTLAEEKIENITCEEVGNVNNDFNIRWHDLIDIDELSVFISMAEKIEPNITSITVQDEKIIKIKNNGNYSIPKSTYKVDKSTIDGIEFNFRTSKTGKTNPQLLENSSITIHTLINRYVKF
jgi:hypothetical protein